MMRYMGLVASLLFSRALGSDVMKAIFAANESYVSGNVTVEDGQIMIDLNITELLENLPSGCVINETWGISYHVHTNWEHASIQSSYGQGCGNAYTGGHYDPYGACGPSTGYSYCSVKGGCIDSTYSCSSGSYGSDAYACEVGDWSGKYGKFVYEGNGIVSANVQSFGEITGNELVGKSIVFHCANNNARAFCASFQNVAGMVTGTARRQTNGYKLKADFSDALGLSDSQEAYFLMNYDGQVEVKFNSEVFDGVTCPGGKLKAWIGGWNTTETGSSMALDKCATIVGNAHDPTNQCYANITDSAFCSNGKLCNDTAYTYLCNYAANPFSCSPMDLSGRYGDIDIAANMNNDIYITTVDRYMADLTNLVHRSVVLTCPTTGQHVLCAKLQSISIGTAVATFTNVDAGAEGTVTVSDGRVSMSLSFSYAAQNYLNGVDLPATCFDSGLKAHIHEKWTYEDTKSRYGARACNATFTGGHWDPWAACGTATGYTSVCSIPPTPSPTSCVAVGGSGGNGKYICNATSYKQNPFLCEVGDWSGKYGVYPFTDDFLVSRSDHSSLEVDASDLVGRSIVFHCAGDGSRAFCAPFILQDGVPDGVDAQPTWPLSTETGNDLASAKATLKDQKSYIMLESNGHYSVDLNISYDENCSSTIAYGVFQVEDCSSSYDPTTQCVAISEHGDGVVCNSQQEICANFPYECDFASSPYSCSPTDLSGKYGITNSQKQRVAEGWDDLMIPLSHLKDRYLGIYCTDTWEIIECHPWVVSTVTTTEQPTTSTSTSTTESAGYQQTYSAGLGLALLIVMSFLY